MHIIHIIEASATGTLSMAALLTNAQIQKGHDVEVIYSRRSETPENLEVYFDPGVKLTNIQMGSLGKKMGAVKSIRARFLNVKPNVVFMHSSFAGFIGRLAGLLILPRTKFLYIPHCISFMREDVGALKKLIFIGFEWIGALKNSVYLSCSQSEQIKISRCIPFRKCILVENAVRDFPTVSDQPAVEKTIITVGQIRDQKGPLEFAAIARDVKKKMPNLVFKWIGDGELEAKDALIEAGVEVTGWVTKEQVLQYLLSSTIYLSTAKWEGMPVSLIEAQYAKLPIVATPCAGNVDVVTHESTGWLFNSPEEASDLILSALSELEQNSTIPEQAYQEAKRRFSVERYVEQIDELMLNGRKE
jgi:glycosyltransferase involved in cell wall biosynthesis